MNRATDWAPSLWRDTFEELLDGNELDYGDRWTLNFSYSQTDRITKEERKRGWKIHSSCAFGNFLCKSCGKHWYSARVVVLFRYRLRGNHGTVVMRPFRQSCSRCEDKFEAPGFSKKVVVNALLELFYKIHKNCYGPDDGGDSSANSKMSLFKPHEASLCEACIMGVCYQEGN